MTDPGRALAAAARAGDRRALGRLLTEVEGRTLAARAALEALYPLAGAAHLVGITGPPGAGKSTLATAIVAEARDQARTVAVLAVDPSSPITGGAILGDRVRMQQHAADDGVFIRSMAARGHAGGLAVATVDAASVLDACGFGLVLIETVGTGQGEVEIASLADTTVVVQAPEMGDEVQALKAGLLEVADIVAVTKADRPGADHAAAALRAMLTVSARQDQELGIARGHTGRRCCWCPPSRALVLPRVEEAGIPVIIVQPSAPFGPGDIKPTPTGRMIIEAASGRMPAYVNTGLNVVHVDDVAAGHLLAYDRGVVGESYILGGENRTLQWILETVAELTGRRPPRIRLPHWFVTPIAYVAEGVARVRGGSRTNVTV